VAFYDYAWDTADVQAAFAAGEVTPQLGDGDWVTDTLYRVSADRALEPEDEGRATVEVTGARDIAGNSESVVIEDGVTLIEGALEIIEQPAVFMWAEAGDPFTLHVEVDGGVGALHYEWRRELKTTVNAIGDDSPELRLDPVEYGDAGYYYCVISDDQSAIQTDPAELVVVAHLRVGPFAALITAIALAAGILLHTPRGRQRRG